MTKTDFAELKERLCQTIDTNKFISNYMQTTGDVPTYAETVGHHEKHYSKIITELIEILQSQSEALEYYKDGNGIDADFDENNGMVYYLEKTKDGLLDGFGSRSRESLSETTTRLQKLREGK